LTISIRGKQGKQGKQGKDKKWRNLKDNVGTIRDRGGKWRVKRSNKLNAETEVKRAHEE
jgi:hypothetical protein